MGSRSKTRRSSGFTLLEMMIVISIMVILMSIALPIYNQSVVRSREAVMRQDLFELRSLISQYTLDKQKAPQGLDDLVTAGYIKVVPKDPMTNEANWKWCRKTCCSPWTSRIRESAMYIRHRARPVATGRRTVPGSAVLSCNPFSFRGIFSIAFSTIVHSHYRHLRA